MQQSLVTIGMLAGGVGLFLLAVHMITDGLKLAAGYALRDLLGKWTRSLLHGIITGLSITALVQSSSAVTVATIGFVNAGLMNLQRALGIVYGSNIGTTMTGWLVAIIGFEIKVEAFALPMIGIGMLLRTISGDSRRGYIGMALTGFGLFFIGIDVLKDAFEGLAEAIDLTAFAVDGVTGLVLYLAIGFLMTVLTQSSSAAIAITLTAVTGGLLDLNIAAAMVIGTNIGTTSTAALAVIGATPNAKRVAAAHFIFNLITGAVALLILPYLFVAVDVAAKLTGSWIAPAVTLAMFHTIFNILGVILMLPLSKSLARFLKRRFVTYEEIEGRPRYLDKTVAVSPALALNALSLELYRIATVTRRMALESMSIESVPGKQIAGDHAVITSLSKAVAEFITRLGKSSLSDEVSEHMAWVLRAEQHLLSCANFALAIVKAQPHQTEIMDEKLAQEEADYRAQVVKLMEMADPEKEDCSYSECEQQLDEVRQAYKDLKASLLRAATVHRIPVPLMTEVLEQNDRIRRMAGEMVRAMLYLRDISMATQAESQPAHKDDEQINQADRDDLPDQIEKSDIGT